MRFYGHIPGVPVGTSFGNRDELRCAGVHRPPMGGISGSSTEAADSIVVSGGYEDDRDYGDEIIYTGQGGNDPVTKKQIGDQQLARGNMGLVKSYIEGLPVRVVRGANSDSPYAPPSGYRYDGLYLVEDYWKDRGKSGFIIWRFRLRAIDTEDTEENQDSKKQEINQARENKNEYKVNAYELDTEQMPVERRPSIGTRLVRQVETAMQVKQWHNHECQVCGIQLMTPAGPYAEAAHIRPLGLPHNGPDTTDNILCLCPNHHKLFDLGAFSIAEDYSLIGLPGRLRTIPAHWINQAHLRYHREHYGILANEIEP